ncbi:13472_t:CDS:2 [Entrophospora sp. SA101]|nr:13472_t:CDS:2 [Entrophospora sp. SA101]
MFQEKKKQKCTAISGLLKKEICVYYQENDKKTHKEIADYFKKWINISSSTHYNIFRHKSVKFPDLEKAMSFWISQVSAQGLVITDKVVAEKAKVFGERLGIDENDLVFSNGWLHGFKQRNNLKAVRIHGEANSAPLENLPLLRNKLKIDSVLTTNATGTRKLKPIVIGKSVNPRCFKNVNMSLLPVIYKSTPKAWMHSDIFEDWLRNLDNQFQRERKHILLLIDNAPSHVDPGSILDEQPEEAIEIEQATTDGIIESLNQSDLSDDLEILEYVNDNELSLTEKPLDDDEIVQMVLDEANNVNNESEGEDIDELKVIATNEDALKAVDTLIEYFEHQNDLENVTEDVKKKANKGEFFVNIGDSLCTNCYNFVVQYDRNQKYNKKNDNKPFKRHESTENIATDNNNSLASIEELQNEITKLKKKIEALTMYSINEMTGKRFRI